MRLIKPPQYLDLENDEFLPPPVTLSDEEPIAAGGRQSFEWHDE